MLMLINAGKKAVDPFVMSIIKLYIITFVIRSELIE